MGRKYAYMAKEDPPVVTPPVIAVFPPVPPPPEPPPPPPGYTYAVYVARCYHSSSYTISIETDTEVEVIVGTTVLDAQSSALDTSHSFTMPAGYAGVWLFVSGATSIPITSLAITSSRVTDVGGLSAFPNLVTLDLSSNGELESLNLGSTSITTVDISDTAIDEIDSIPSGIVSVDAENTAYVAPDFSDKTSLTTLNLAGVAVTSVDVSGCSALTSLTIDTLSALTSFDASESGLTSLDLTGCATLTTLDVDYAADLASLDLTNCSGLPTSIDLSNGLTSLATLTLTGTGITTVDASGTAITSWSGSDYVSVTLEGCTSLVSVDMAANTSLTTLNVAGCTALTTVDVNGCTSLATFTFTTCTALVDLDASSASLSSGECDTILSNLDGLGAENGTVDVSDNDYISAAGIQDKEDLEGKGWTVYADIAIEGGFSVTPANFTPTRGAAFNITIQALNDDGIPDTTYAPSGDVAISIDSDDPSDIISPTTTDNTGWSNGSKVVSVTISGGSGVDTASITCSQSTDEKSGSAGVAVGSSSSKICTLGTMLKGRNEELWADHGGSYATALVSALSGVQAAFEASTDFNAAHSGWGWVVANGVDKSVAEVHGSAGSTAMSAGEWGSLVGAVLRVTYDPSTDATGDITVRTHYGFSAGDTVTPTDGQDIKDLGSDFTYDITVNASGPAFTIYHDVLQYIDGSGDYLRFNYWQEILSGSVDNDSGSAYVDVFVRSLTLYFS